MKNNQSFKERFKRYNLTVQRLEKAKIDLSGDLDSVIKQLLDAPDSLKIRQSFILIKDILSADESTKDKLQKFADDPKFSFIIALDTMECQPFDRSTIESVWVYSKEDNITVKDLDNLSRSLNTRLFDKRLDHNSLHNGIENNRIGLQNLMKSINATEAIVQNMMKAASESAKAVIIPEKRAATLIEQVQAFIEKITEKIFALAKAGTNMEKESEIYPKENIEESRTKSAADMLAKANEWRGKITSSPDTKRSV